MNTSWSRITLVFTFSMAVPQCAWAQTVDYGSLQSLFGEPVTTSATGTPQRAKNIPANMTIITADDIRRSGSRSIPEIQRQVPGIDVMQSGSQSYDVGVRGYNQAFQPRLLVLLNGRQVFLDDYSRTDWNAIPVNIDEIRQIEVVKGPNAALFGSNAVGGVINIVTYNPMYDKVRVANVTAGTQESREASTTVTEKLDDWGGIKLSAGGLNNQEFDTGRTPVDASVTVDPSRRFASAEGIFQLAPDIQGELETTYVKSQASGAAFNTGVYSESSEEISSFKGMLADQTNIGLLKATAYWNHVLSGLEVASTPSTYLTNDLYVIQLEDEFKIGKVHTFRIASEYRNNQFNLDADQAVLQHPEIQYETFSESAMWNWQVLKNLTFTNALRVDERQETLAGMLGTYSDYTYNNYNQYNTGINANSGLVYQATDIDTLRLTFGRGLQYPSFDESGVLITASTGGPALINIQGNPSLTPTVVTNYEMDYDRDIKSIFSTARSGVFYAQNEAVKAQITTPGVFPVVANITGENVGDSHAVGLEWGINGQHEGYRWGASYSLSDVTDDPTVKSNLHYEKSAPQNSVKLNLGYTWQQWEIDGFCYYVSSRESLLQPYGSSYPAQLVTTDGYASLSGRIGYNINDNITLALSGTGLNRQYFDATAYPNIERQVFLGVTGKF